jgi:acetyl-CoA synthetase
VIAAISNFIDVGDTTTLANPEIVEALRTQVQSAKVKLGEVPEGVPDAVREDLRQFGEES